MTQPADQFDEYSQTLTDLIKQAGEMTVEAAKLADADDFGIDARISAAHKFVDMEIKGHAKLLETLIKGPLVPVVSGTPMDSDPISVAPVPYPRSIEAIAPWRRVAYPQIDLPVHLIKLPPVLPANVGQFRIGVKDYNYIGSNYRGTLRLRPTSTAMAAQAPLDITVTAGL